MSDEQSFHILPYSNIIGQDDIKLALEIAYIAPGVGGVLLSGHRGTGKSTAVRSFARMMFGELPVTIPINATEDRVIGGWRIDELMRGDPKPQSGLLEDANGNILYVDEINLLDDHIVNIILDVTATGVLVIQREGRNETKNIKFTLVGTMNPEEGDLRPQLLDRFGLMVNVTSEVETQKRHQILETVLAFDKAKVHGEKSEFLKQGYGSDTKLKNILINARSNLYSVAVPEKASRFCIQLAEKFNSIGHRGDFVLALAARALAALENNNEVTFDHIKNIAHLALQHRRNTNENWTDKDNEMLNEALSDV